MVDLKNAGYQNYKNPKTWVLKLFQTEFDKITKLDHHVLDKDIFNRIEIV